MKTTIAAFTAAAIGFTALTATATTSAQAAPLGAPVAQAVQVDENITTVGHHHRRRNAATAAGIVIGLSALALGAAAASQPRQRCYIETIEVWSPRRQAYILKEREVCH
ncbi:hypothetical protein DLJ53_04575 [Acuticoccus sediminis]|uniref:Uncharacterized protein n=1 Tax=Acuticoccus sediminis TaxID=2184697 RepID=A0A8B2P0T0_9HYPH|nr:hypothetical protein [Acuticoccus sediminis]RAI03756.1 hypothetical protein DLJ53_04575 [Acuticoccus sediminis]